MTDMVNDLTGGTPGTPNPPASPAGAPTSVDMKTFVAALKTDSEFASIVKELALPVAQSTKDRRFDKLEKTQASFAEQLAEFQRWKTIPGVSDEAAIALMEATQRNVVPTGPAVPQAGQAPQTAEPSVDMTQLLNVLGLAQNDAEVTQILRNGGNTHDFIALAVKRRSQPAPNVATVLPTGSGQTVPSEDDLETLTAQLDELMKHPAENWQSIKKVKERQAALLPKR